jgi:hypothetical protein
MIYLVDRIDVWTQATVYTENTTIDDSTEGQVVKYFTAIPPNIGATIFPLAFIVESIDLWRGIKDRLVALGEDD